MSLQYQGNQSIHREWPSGTNSKIQEEEKKQKDGKNVADETQNSQETQELRPITEINNTTENLVV